jgi:type IV pilus assembly protein PilP
VKRKNNKSEHYAMKIFFFIQLVLIIFCVVAFAETPVPGGTESLQPILAENSTVPSGELPAPVVEAKNEFPSWISSQDPPYNARNKIDPFVSFVKIREFELMQAAKKTKVEKKATTPLETVDVHSLKLIGIISKDGSTPLAMVELPDGKGYLIRPGMTLGLYDGVVTSIGNEILVVEEDVIDVFGEAKKRTINLRLRQEKE